MGLASLSRRLKSEQLDNAVRLMISNAARFLKVRDGRLKAETTLLNDPAIVSTKEITVSPGQDPPERFLITAQLIGSERRMGPGDDGVQV